jgi:hypothetical protein
MLISIILTVLLLYVAFNTKLYGDKLPQWILYSIALLTLASWESAIVMLGICIYCLYNGVKSGEINTLNWIENLIK